MVVLLRICFHLTFQFFVSVLGQTSAGFIEKIIGGIHTGFFLCHDLIVEVDACGDKVFESPWVMSLVASFIKT
jgi:hypothetical protein